MGEEPLFDDSTDENTNNPRSTTEAETTRGHPTDASSETPHTAASAGRGKENFTVLVDSEPITIDEKTTASELKDMKGARKDDLLTFRDPDNDKPRQINDDEFVLDYVTPGTDLTFQPAKGDIFG